MECTRAWNPRAFCELKRLVSERLPTLLFIRETKNSSHCRFLETSTPLYRTLYCRLPRPYWWAHAALKREIRVTIKSYSKGHIDCTIHYQQITWRFTSFYGNPVSHLRTSSWELMRRLHTIPELQHIPWLVGGDFNEIMFTSDKKGGIHRCSNQMQEFREAIDDCCLAYLHCKGDLFTWMNRRSGNGIILERLDRFLGNLEWRNLFPDHEVFNLEYYGSDHRPIMLQFCSEGYRNIQHHPKRFFFKHK